jgi:DNA-binding transcriptional ArsR family regulator
LAAAKASRTRAALRSTSMSRHAISSVAALLGEPTRAAIVLALLDGRALPAGELAREARLSAAATSLHLAKLTQGGLLTVRQEGRHRYYGLANDDVAHAIEALGVIATAPPPAPSTPDRAALRAARTCYDHLAGALGVELARVLDERGVLRAQSITPRGARWLADAMRIDADELARSRRTLVRTCLDWTERRPHVAGALGAAMLARFFDARWLARIAGTRAVRVTPRGRDAFAELGVP